MATALEQDPGMIDQLKQQQDAPLSYGEPSSSVTDLGSFSSSDPGLEPEGVPQPDVADQDVDAMP